MKTTKKNKRFVQIKAFDPVCVEIDKTKKMNYYNIGYRGSEKLKAPEEYPDGEEPIGQIRYLLTIGDYEYFVTRDGKIMDVVSGPDKNNMF